jgi:hypothetical protein
MRREEREKNWERKRKGKRFKRHTEALITTQSIP